MLLQNPLKEDDSRTIKEIEGKYFLGENELLSLTEEQKNITKTDANYYFKGKENGMEFFCHLNKEKGKFWIAETFDGISHDVWLANNKSVTYYENNIVFRDNEKKESFPFQDAESIKEIINKQYGELVNEKTFIMFEDTIRGESSYIERLGDKWFKFGEELKSLTEEQKNMTKTGAQYAVTNEKGTFFYHLNEETKQFALSETVSSLSHDVWLKDRQSITYYDKGTVLRDHKNKKDFPLSVNTDLSDLINESYNKNIIKDKSIENNTAIETNHNPTDKVEVESIKEIKQTEKENFFQGLKRELRETSVDSISMTAIYGVKDLLSKGMKKNKFLTLGASAAMLALVASSPVVASGLLVGGALVAIGAAFHVGITTAMKIDEAVTQKFHDFQNKDSLAIEAPKEKSLYEVKSSISKIRNDALETQKNNNKNQM